MDVSAMIWLWDVEYTSNTLWDVPDKQWQGILWYLLKQAHQVLPEQNPAVWWGGDGTRSPAVRIAMNSSEFGRWEEHL